MSFRLEWTIVNYHSFPLSAVPTVYPVSRVETLERKKEITIVDPGLWWAIQRMDDSIVFSEGEENISDNISSL